MSYIRNDVFLNGDYDMSGMAMMEYMAAMQGVQLILAGRVETIDEMEKADYMPLRLLDHFAGVALKLAEGQERVVLLLNTAIAGVVRECLEGKHGKHLQTNYPFALAVKEYAAGIRAEEVMAFNKVMKEITRG
jgi:hypothetical protein